MQLSVLFKWLFNFKWNKTLLNNWSVEVDSTIYIFSHPFLTRCISLSQSSSYPHRTGARLLLITSVICSAYLSLSHIYSIRLYVPDSDIQTTLPQKMLSLRYSRLEADRRSWKQVTRYLCARHSAWLSCQRGRQFAATRSDCLHLWTVDWGH